MSNEPEATLKSNISFQKARFYKWTMPFCLSSSRIEAKEIFCQTTTTLTLDLPCKFMSNGGFTFEYLNLTWVASGACTGRN